MTYILLIHAEDGTHSHVSLTAAGCQQELESQLGRSMPEFWLNKRRTYFDDWGRRLVIEERPDGWTEDKEKHFERGFDNIECGFPLTPEQRSALMEMGVHEPRQLED